MASQTKSLARLTRQEVKTVGEEIDVSRKSLKAVQDQAESARAQARFSQMALESTFRPVLISIPPNWHGFQPGVKEVFAYEPNAEPVQIDPSRGHAIDWRVKAERIFVSVPVRNVGPGVAFITGTEFTGKLATRTKGSWKGGIVPPKESARVLFVLTSEVEQRLPRRDAPLPTAFAQHERFTVYIYYEDIGGHQWTTEVHAEVRADEGLRWFVREVLVGSRGAPQHEMVGSAEWIWT
ncbi:MAG: hypothetical protein E6G22_12150 [Actinobacteria bacterium]|nr:MAG: hypothetical protein E6G22_12150 [Actinomycetota bacterium]